MSEVHVRFDSAAYLCCSPNQVGPDASSRRQQHRFAFDDGSDGEISARNKVKDIVLILEYFLKNYKLLQKQ